MGHFAEMGGHELIMSSFEAFKSSCEMGHFLRWVTNVAFQRIIFQWKPTFYFINRTDD